MKKKIIFTAVVTSMVVYLLSSCYKNREDVQALPRISFRNEVVPIMTSGPCGCHNNGTTRAVQFSHVDTVYYDAILSRLATFEQWVNPPYSGHPGGGNIDFSASEKNVIQQWLAQGDPYDDGAGCTVTGNLTYTNDIVPIYNTTCKGGTCHGGIAVSIDYNKMVQEKNMLITIMNSGGNQGHPGGPLSLTTCTINKFKEWINQGQPQ